MCWGNNNAGKGSARPGMIAAAAPQPVDTARSVQPVAPDQAPVPAPPQVSPPAADITGSAKLPGTELKETPPLTLPGVPQVSPMPMPQPMPQPVLQPQPPTMLPPIEKPQIPAPPPVAEMPFVGIDAGSTMGAPIMPQTWGQQPPQEMPRDVPELISALTGSFGGGIDRVQQLLQAAGLPATPFRGWGRF